MAKLIIPTPLRKFTDNQGSFETEGATVQEAIETLTELFPDLKKHLLEADGKIRSFVRIYVGDDDIKALDHEKTSLNNDSVVSIIPAIAGGSAGEYE
ncbi:MAG: MoaD/ThiS family protein [Bacteroidota bacterium]